MAISRRLFVSTGLLCVVGVWYVKGIPSLKGLPILSNNIESFFESYELSIPVKESSDAFGETEILEKKLVSLLSTEGMEETIITINKMDAKTLYGLITFTQEFETCNNNYNHTSLFCFPRFYFI